jgi:hypothetical protein
MSVVQDGAVMNFDTFDKRDNWIHGEADGDPRATIVPDGRTTGTPNWAARIVYDAQTPGSFPVGNRQLALQAGTNYSICFASKQGEASSVAGQVELQSGGSVVSSLAFSAGFDWQTTCVVTGTLPSDDNELRFGFNQPHDGVGSYLVDDISTSCVPYGCGGACGDVADGCGGTLHCGDCSDGLVCVRNVCLDPTCIPRKCPKGNTWNASDCVCEPIIAQ